MKCGKIVLFSVVYKANNKFGKSVLSTKSSNNNFPINTERLKLPNVKVTGR